MKMVESEAIRVIKILNLCGLCTTGPCGDCERKQAKEEALLALEEIQQYREIGTVEECREAKERQRSKKPMEYEDKYYGCPTCGNPLMHKWEKYPNIPIDKSNGLPYCLGCGQKLDWSETV